MHVYVVNQVINLHNLSYFLLRKTLFLQALAEGLNQKLMKGIGRSSAHAGNSETDRLAMDVALAGLSFGTPGCGLACDAAMSEPFGTDAVKLSVSAEDSLNKHFERGARHAGLSGNR